MHLADKAPIRAIYSPSHPVQVVREGDRRATVSYEAQNVRPDRDFDLYYSLSPDAVAVNLLSYKPYDEDGFFLLLVTPPVEAARQAVAKDVILVLDTSGSMDGEKIARPRTRPTTCSITCTGDRFNIVAFSTATRLFATGPCPWRSAPTARLRAQLGQPAAPTSTAALLEAVAGADRGPADGRHLPDRRPAHGGRGESRPDRREDRGRGAQVVRLFTFGVGYDVDTVLLDQLSSGQRGASAYVKPEQSIEEEVSGFYAKVSAPVPGGRDGNFAGVRSRTSTPIRCPTCSPARSWW